MLPSLRLGNAKIKRQSDFPSLTHEFIRGLIGRANHVGLALPDKQRRNRPMLVCIPNGPREKLSR